MNLQASSACQTSSQIAAASSGYQSSCAQCGQKGNSTISQNNNASAMGSKLYGDKQGSSGEGTDQANNEESNSGIMEKLFNCIKMLLSALMSMIQQDNGSDGESEPTSSSKGASGPDGSDGGQDKSPSGSNKGSADQSGKNSMVSQLMQLIMQLLSMMLQMLKGDSDGGSGLQSNNGDASKAGQDISITIS